MVVRPLGAVKFYMHCQTRRIGRIVEFEVNDVNCRTYWFCRGNYMFSFFALIAPEGREADRPSFMTLCRHWIHSIYCVLRSSRRFNYFLK